jgi:hypothetical protein
VLEGPLISPADLAAIGAQLETYARNTAQTEGL